MLGLGKDERRLVCIEFASKGCSSKVLASRQMLEVQRFLGSVDSIVRQGLREIRDESLNDLGIFEAVSSRSKLGREVQEVQWFI